MSNCCIFAGQGAQTPGMGKDFAEADAEAMALFDKANAVLGFDLKKICFEGPAEELTKSNICQPAIFVTSYAAYMALQKVRKTDFACAAGLSLGEWGALCVAGVLDFDSTLKVLEARGRFMQEACEAAPSGMIAIVGASAEQLAALCEKTGCTVGEHQFVRAAGAVRLEGGDSQCGRCREGARNQACDSAGDSGGFPLAVHGACAREARARSRHRDIQCAEDSGSLECHGQAPLERSRDDKGDNARTGDRHDKLGGGCGGREGARVLAVRRVRPRQGTFGARQEDRRVACDVQCGGCRQPWRNRSGSRLRPRLIYTKQRKANTWQTSRVKWR